jgi:glycosyltransferase involved in cell wall biosynthesis
MKRVLVVSFDFPPAGGTSTIRITKFVKYLPEFGWQPVVVCSDVAWRPDASLLSEIPASVNVVRVGWPRLVRAMRPDLPVLGRTPDSAAGIAAASRGRGLKRWAGRLARGLFVPDVNVLWTYAARRACEDVLRTQPCDAVLTTSPPNSVHLVGEWLHTRHKLPWAADFRDVWTAENETLRQTGWLHFARQRMVERRILHSSDRAIMITEPLANRAAGVFGPQLAEHMTTVTNGFDPADFAGPPPPLDVEHFTIVYVGTIVGPWTQNAFPEGLRLALAQDAGFRAAARMRFVGALAPEYAARLQGLEANVEIAGFAAHADAIAAMRCAHLLLLTLTGSDLARMTHTNKFFEYLAAGRPILGVVPPGLVADVITQENIGMVAPPDDAAAIARTLLAMYQTLRANPAAQMASPALLARYNRRELTRQLAGVLDDISGGKDARA